MSSKQKVELHKRMSLDSSKDFCIIIILEAVVVKEQAKLAPEKKGKN